MTTANDSRAETAIRRTSGTPSLACTAHCGTAEATDGMGVWVTYGMRKFGNSWLIAHDQASVPLDISTGKGVTDLEP
jgi:hypothetical protein